MLEPLQQWICDSCGEIIQTPKQGWVEWKETDRKKHDFRIVHHRSYSPRKHNSGSCYYSNAERDGDLHLFNLLGPDGLVVLTSWIDVGKWHQEEYIGPEVRDLREWTVLVRRLHVPYYEEARTLTDEMCDVRNGGANEVYLYQPDTLRAMIEKRELNVAE